jgi:hypothetical protein
MRAASIPLLRDSSRVSGVPRGITGRRADSLVIACSPAAPCREAPGASGFPEWSQAALAERMIAARKVRAIVEPRLPVRMVESFSGGVGLINAGAERAKHPSIRSVRPARPNHKNVVKRNVHCA